MERTIPFILAWDENLDIGSDAGTPVDDKDYQVPFQFTGKIDSGIDKRQGDENIMDRPYLVVSDTARILEHSGRKTEQTILMGPPTTPTRRSVQDCTKKV